MSSDEPTDDPRFQEIEERLNRLENTVDDLREIVEARRRDRKEQESAPAPTARSESDAPEKTGTTGSDSSTEVPPSREPDPPTGRGTPAELEESGKPTSSTESDQLEDEEAPAETAQSERLEEPSDADPTEDAEPSSVNDALRHYATIFGLRSADWISYVGIGLLLFGLAFLFRYSIEQGWITPVVRVGFGGAIGIGLLVAGMRRAGDRPLLQQILLGGSSAAFYGTIFAAYQLYSLLAYPVAFGSMLFITIMTIVLGLQQDYASTAFIGTAGGLGTPFLLFTQADGGASLALYTCLVVGGACIMYLYRGWRSLIYLASIGGWIVLVLATYGTDADDVRWGLQFSIMLGWVLLGGTPVLRSFLRTHQPERWPPIEFPQPRWLSFLSGDHPPGPVLMSPAFAFLATRQIWPNAPELIWATVAAVGAFLYGGLYWHLHRNDLINYAPVHGVVAAALAAYSLGKMLSGPAMLIAWGVEAALLPLLSRRLDDTLLRISGHTLAALVFTTLFGRFLFLDPASPPLVSPEALSELVVLGLLATIPWQIDSRLLQRVYQCVLIVGWLNWWAHKLGVFSETSSYMLLVVSLSALALLVIGSRWHLLVPRVVAHLLFALCAITVGKRLLDGSTAVLPIFHLPGVSKLVVLSTGLVAARVLSDTVARRIYQGSVLVGWLGWTLHEFVVLPNGHAYVSLLWGGTSVLLLTGGAWLQRPLVQKTGLAVLAVFVFKLFFVDLATLPTLGRIGLFLGTGMGFLLISYLLPGVGSVHGDETV